MYHTSIIQSSSSYQGAISIITYKHESSLHGCMNLHMCHHIIDCRASSYLHHRMYIISSSYGVIQYTSSSHIPLFHLANICVRKKGINNIQGLNCSNTLVLYLCSVKSPIPCQKSYSSWACHLHLNLDLKFVCFLQSWISSSVHHIKFGMILPFIGCTSPCMPLSSLTV